MHTKFSDMGPPIAGVSSCGEEGSEVERVPRGGRGQRGGGWGALATKCHGGGLWP